MSFISILKKVGSAVLGIEHVAEPVIETLFPSSKPLFDVFDRLQTAITTVESANPLQNGQLKSQTVVSDFEAGLSVTQAILSADGKKLVYDDAALQSAINAQVAAYNAFAALKASFKVVALNPPAPGAAPQQSTTAILD